VSGQRPAVEDLARGTAEDLRQRVEAYRASLQLLRRLVPERSEVPNLLDAITSRARMRGVTLSQVSPLPQEAGPAPFATQKYGLAEDIEVDAHGLVRAPTGPGLGAAIDFDLIARQKTAVLT